MSLKYHSIVHKTYVALSQRPSTTNENLKPPERKKSLHCQGVLEEVTAAENDLQLQEQSEKIRKAELTSELTGKPLIFPVHRRRHTDPSFRLDNEGMIGRCEWDRRPNSTTAKRLRTPEKELLLRSLSPIPAHTHKRI